MIFKALSIKPQYALQIAMGTKRIEYRSWQTSYRGPLLICSSQNPKLPYTFPGKAICLVDLVDIKKYDKRDYGWILRKVRLVEPFAVKGKLHLFEVNAKPTIQPEFNNSLKKEKWLNEHFWNQAYGLKQLKNGKWVMTTQIKEKFGKGYNWKNIN